MKEKKIALTKKGRISKRFSQAGELVGMVETKRKKAWCTL